MKRHRLVGDCILTSSFLSYCGAFTYEFRHAMAYELWAKDLQEKQLPVTVPFRCAATGTALTPVVTCGQTGKCSMVLLLNNARHPVCP